MAQHKLIEMINSRTTIFISVIGIIVVFAARYMVASIFGLLLDVIYAPLFICFASNIFEKVGKYKIIKKMFCVFGKYSTGMWFFHAVFFSTYVCDVFQPILLLVKPPVLMYVWLVILSLAGAFVYERLLECIKAVPRIVKSNTRGWNFNGKCND
jgi:hypothetical protein